MTRHTSHQSTRPAGWCGQGVRSRCTGHSWTMVCGPPNSHILPHPRDGVYAHWRHGAQRRSRSHECCWFRAAPSDGVHCPCPHADRSPRCAVDDFWTTCRSPLVLPWQVYNKFTSLLRNIAIPCGVLKVLYTLYMI